MSKDNPILDLRGMPYRKKVEALLAEAKNANRVWENYDIDPRLKEKFKTLELILEDYSTGFKNEV